MRLSTAEIAKAVKWNPVYQQQVGWNPHYEKVLKVLGFPNTCPVPERFAQAVADWQDAHRPRLTPDGMLGPSTWKALKPVVLAAPGSGPTLPPPTGGGPMWLQYAQAQLNRWETETNAWAGSGKDADKAEKHLDWDELYFQGSPYWGGKAHADGATPGTKNLDWCAAFVNWCLHRSGFSHTGSAGAASFVSRTRWRFDALKEPRKGCVVVVGNSQPAHVAFLWSWTNLPSDPKGDVEMPWGRSMQLLGGNQGNTVQIKSDRRKLQSVRGQNGVTSPYLWPIHGAATCTITSVPSDEAHFCGCNPV